MVVETARRRTLAIGLTALALALYAAQVVMLLASRPAGAIQAVLQVLPLQAFAIGGGLLAVKVPANRVGWICLASGLGWSVAFFADSYEQWGKDVLHHSPPIADWLALVGWVIPLGLLATFLLLYFPDGQLPSPRWRWVARLSGVTIAVLTFVVALGTDDNGKYQNIPDFLVPLRPVASALGAIIVLFPVCLLASLASLIVRYRRASFEEREKLKWIAYAFAVVIGVYLLTFLLSITTDWNGPRTPPLLGALQTFSLMLFGLIPVSVAFAVLRYRLYDIDRIISRTVSYALISIVLVGLYLSVVLLGSVTLGSRGSEPAWVVALSTLLVAFLFAPLRRRVQSGVDRRFNRRRYDAMRTMDEFIASLRTRVELGDVESSLRRVLGVTLAPSTVSIWIPEQSTKRP